MKKYKVIMFIEAESKSDALDKNAMIAGYDRINGKAYQPQLIK